MNAFVDSCLPPFDWFSYHLPQILRGLVWGTLGGSALLLWAMRRKRR